MTTKEKITATITWFESRKRHDEKAAEHYRDVNKNEEFRRYFEGRVFLYDEILEQLNKILK